MLLSHVFLMIESLGGCRAVRLRYPVLAGHESMLRVHKYFFFLKDCLFVQLQTLMARAQVSHLPCLPSGTPVWVSKAVAV